MTTAILISVLAAQVAGCSWPGGSSLGPEDFFFEPSELRLAEAACKGDTAEIGRLVGQGTSPNVAGRKSMTPLMMAVSCQSESGVSALLDAGADVSQTMDGGENAVWVAAGLKDTSILRKLIDRGGDMHVMNPAGETPLTRSLSPTLSDANFHLLVESGVDINQVDSREGTAARHAIALGRVDLAVELMKAGFNYDLVALAYSADSRSYSRDRLGDLEELRNLLSRKGVVWPLPELLNDEGRTAYMMANPAYAAAHPESWPVRHELHPGVSPPILRPAID